MSIAFHDPRGKIGIELESYGLGFDLDAAPAPTIGFLANGFPDSVPFLAHLDAALRQRLPNMHSQHWNKGDASITATPAMLSEIQGQCDVAIAAWGH